MNPLFGEPEPEEDWWMVDSQVREYIENNEPDTLPEIPQWDEEIEVEYD